MAASPDRRVSSNESREPAGQSGFQAMIYPFQVNVILLTRARHKCVCPCFDVYIFCSYWTKLSCFYTRKRSYLCRNLKSSQTYINIREGLHDRRVGPIFYYVMISHVWKKTKISQTLISYQYPAPPHLPLSIFFRPTQLHPSLLHLCLLSL